ncbi:hypothetical protein AMS68_003060 [Peltaster fructicola]|uniref:Probable 26S proteasome regulatory subunit p27 n=1 Tax=Peltaster fructicola TaxID=286661 RepID=A0A6H0XS54_9PEZI|nr:hypothetical protein AMS68_003060 [Peltaster fructicola]
MDNLHAPTVPSGPSSSHSTNGHAEKKSLQELIISKENLEAQLSALGAVLDSHGVNMSTSLTSFDGYPRADIDVAQIRTTRAQIIRLKNDHKALMKELEDAVHEGFANNSKSTTSTPAPPAVSSSQQATPQPTGPIEAPFAKVNTVVTGSPADEAGLKAGDRVTRFGFVDWTNHERLTKVAEVVRQNKDRAILVRVTRETTSLQLRLTPRDSWGGRGMLGCHLLPL